MAKWEVRACTEIAFDFLINAEDEDEAREIVEGYLKYVSGGEAEGQKIRVDVEGENKLTHCFVMECHVEDVNKAD